ncbi:MAG TPA: hypothetical protein VJI71_01255 [Candidatus Norongarragalinales archaeon]|nr:hypothetical protein [Candidatus Norongarragalinales archaeon]
MKVLVVGSGEVARKIGEGAADAGASVEYAQEYSEGHDLVFLDAEKASENVKGSTALFHVSGWFSGSFEKALSKLSNAKLVNQISLGKKGILKNRLDEIDLERARAFGERTVRNMSGHKFEKKSEKQRIKGYRKQYR